MKIPSDLYIQIKNVRWEGMFGFYLFKKGKLFHFWKKYFEVRSFTVYLKPFISSCSSKEKRYTNTLEEAGV